VSLKEDIREALRQVIDPELGDNLVDLNMIRQIEENDGRVTVAVALTTPGCPLKNELEKDIKKQVGMLPGVKEVQVAFGEMTPQEKEKLTASNQPKIPSFAGTKILAVGSGKGGVGKSTLTVNLAVGLKQLGYRVGILDADIYGFSIPRLLGLVGRQPTLEGENRILPLVKNGLKVISTGFFFPEDQPLIWRAPILTGLLQQFLGDVEWGELDYLLIDLPPGTGDVPLSIMQLLPQSRLLVVTTPQSSASHVAGRIGYMARAAKVPVVGVVENMSYFECEHGSRYYIFGRGTTEEMASSLGVPILGRVPLELAIREQSDAGEPVAENLAGYGSIFKEIAEKVVESLEEAVPSR